MSVSPTSRVLGLETLAPGVFVLHLDRQRKEREYSVYSGEADSTLSVLIKEIPDGVVSHQLARLRPGDSVSVSGPYGYFLLEPSMKARVPLLWVATGTGISPFHSFARTYPDAPYRLLHGVRTVAERRLSRGFDPAKVITCVSAEPGGDFFGRVTRKLPELDLSPSTHAFLCGNCDMIYEAFDLLQARGIPAGQIFTEVYY